MRGIDGYASHGTDLLALGLIEMPDALSAFVRMDLIDQRPHEDGVIRALGFANVAIDAIVGDHQGHGVCLSCGRLRFFSAAIVLQKGRRI